MELSEGAKALVQESVRETLFNVGINVSTPDDVLEARKDQNWVRETRLGSERLKTHGGMAAMLAALTALFTILGFGIRAWIEQISKGPHS